jgi:hypothetical protein
MLTCRNLIFNKAISLIIRLIVSKKDSLAACTKANNSALVVDVIIVSCLFVRQLISPLTSFMAKICVGRTLA